MCQKTGIGVRGRFYRVWRQGQRQKKQSGQSSHTLCAATTTPSVGGFQPNAAFVGVSWATLAKAEARQDHGLCQGGN
jgi:hypothetical protein